MNDQLLPRHGFQARPRVVYAGLYSCGYYATAPDGKVVGVCHQPANHPCHQPTQAEFVERGMAFINDFDEDTNVAWATLRKMMEEERIEAGREPYPQKFWELIKACYKGGWVAGVQHTLTKLTGLEVPLP